MQRTDFIIMYACGIRADFSGFFPSRRRIILCVLRSESDEAAKLFAAPILDVHVLERGHHERLYSKTVWMRGGDEIGVRVK